jgi:hypothetical protein
MKAIKKNRKRGKKRGKYDRIYSLLNFNEKYFTLIKLTGVTLLPPYEHYLFP